MNGKPLDRVEVLAEDDAAGLEPLFVNEKPADDRVLGVPVAVRFQGVLQAQERVALSAGRATSRLASAVAVTTEVSELPMLLEAAFTK